jgi:hypothetical protein
MQRNAHVFQDLPPGVGRILRLCAVELSGETLQCSERVDVGATAAKELDNLMTKRSVFVCHSASDARMPGEVARRGLLDVSRNRDLALAIGEEVAHATDLRSNAAQLLFNPLISPVDMVDAVEDGLTIRDQRSQHQGGRGA